MGPLSSYYSQEVNIWLRNNPGKVVTAYQVAELFGRAYDRASTTQVARSGFRKPGIYPYDPTVFQDGDFAAAETTERPPQNVTVPSFGSLEDGDAIEAILQAPIDIQDLRSNPQPGCSNQNSRPTTPVPSCSILRVSAPTTPLAKSYFLISPEVVLPVPHVVRKEVENRKRGKSAVLTSTPYKDELLELETKKSSKKTAVMANRVKRNICGEKTIDGIRQRRGKNIKLATQAKHKRKKKTSSSEEDTDETDTDDSDVACIYCHEYYSKTTKTDGWICCTKCSNWAHESCTRLPDEALDEFVCDTCRN